MKALDLLRKIIEDRGHTIGCPSYYQIEGEDCDGSCNSCWEKTIVSLEDYVEVE
jgi:hypothetical protein